MSYATSYHFFFHNFEGQLVATETWVFREDTKENRSKTRNWFKRFVESTGFEYKGDSYIDFLTEDIKTARSLISDSQLVIHVRRHT